jgi:peptide/nickel transport system substrate-binding protein
VRWQDGTPLTTDDLLFTAQVARDKDLAILIVPAFDLVRDIEALDPQTLRVTWRTSYIEADRLFSAAGSDALLPMPKHLLERTYLEDKPSFTSHPYWGGEFVGAGPFRVREFIRGSHMILNANDSYALGRPRLDEIEVRFIPDPNAAIANLLAGAAELTLGRRISLDQAVMAREQWKEGRVDISFASWVAIFPQFLNPTPAIITDSQFRRGLLHATDRQQLVDTIQFGMVPVAHSILNPNQPQYREVEAALPRYEYDPRRTGQILEGLGYSRGGDGFFRDGAGQRLQVELQTNSGDDLREKTLLATADHWQRAGVGVDQVLVPLQLRTNREYKSTRPGFELVRQPNDVEGLTRLHGSQVPVAENNYRGDNRARYRNSEYDALVDRYFTTIPARERVPILGEIARHVAENAVLLGLFYGDRPILIGNRVKNVAAAGQASSEAWNAHEWDAS